MPPRVAHSPPPPPSMSVHVNFISEVASLNGTLGRRPLVNLWSIELGARTQLVRVYSLTNGVPGLELDLRLT